MIAHGIADALQQQEGRVPLIHVEDIGFDAHGAQQANAADAQQHLLPDARAPVAAVEPVGQITIFFQQIVFDIAVQKIKGRAPHLHLPDLRVEFAPGQRQRDLESPCPRRRSAALPAD